MRNNQTYKQLKTMALFGGYTIAQVENATYEQIRSLLSNEAISDSFIDGMKDLLVRELRRNGDESDKQFIVSCVDLPNLKGRFPDVEFEKDKESGKRKITMWIDGKPEGG